MIFKDTDKTVFVARGADKAISGLWTVRQFAGQEELLEDDPAVVAFRTPSAAQAIKQQLAQIDAATGSQRWLRELALAFGALTKMLNSVGFKDAGGTVVPDTTGNSGMLKVQAIEGQAIVLRKKLAALPPA